MSVPLRRHSPILHVNSYVCLSSTRYVQLQGNNQRNEHTTPHQLLIHSMHLHSLQTEDNLRTTGSHMHVNAKNNINQLITLAVVMYGCSCYITYTSSVSCFVLYALLSVYIDTCACTCTISFPALILCAVNISQSDCIYIKVDVKGRDKLGKLKSKRN